MNSAVKKAFSIVGKVVFGVFTLFAITYACVGLYLMGINKGYSMAIEEIDNQISEHVVKNDQKTSANQVTTIVVTPTPSKNIVYKKTNWGGPELWDAVNKKRSEYGVNPLTQKDELCTIASIRLNELLELGKLDGHEGFSNLEERRPDLTWIIEKYSTMAEFLAWGGDSAEETVSLWEGTLGHRKLLTGGEYVWGCVYAQNSFAVAITAF
jgi:uncharacterized protein YkwD